MNAVNLLPQKHRPRRASGGQQGSSFVLLGALAAIVVAVLVYVLSVNSINSAKSDIASAKAETVRANAQADALGAYGNFAKVKDDRVKAVKDLAGGRTDWERTLREVAHVLPSGVWITSADASDGADASVTTSTTSTTSSQGSSASQGSGAGAPQAAAVSSSPAITLKACAPSQDAVANSIVRLRELDGAKDVTLDHSTQATPETSASSGGSAGTAGSAASGGGSNAGCGETHGVANYEFQVLVTLDSPSPAPYVPGKVPASLGGGQ